MSNHTQSIGNETSSEEQMLILVTYNVMYKIGKSQLHFIYFYAVTWKTASSIQLEKLILKFAVCTELLTLLIICTNTKW